MIDRKVDAFYVKLEALKSMTKNEAKNLLWTDSKQDECEIKKNAKDFGCYLYGAKYYCISNTANKVEIVFDFCEKVEIQAGIKNTNDHNEDDSKAITTRTMGQKRLEQTEKLNVLQNMEHKSGFKSINFEKKDRDHSDGNCFYVNSQSVSQQQQLRHCFLRIYAKNNQNGTNVNKKNKENKHVKKIKLVQDLEHMHGYLKVFSRTMKPKLCKLIPFFIVLCQFLFDKCESNLNYMSLMESIGCLLVLKNYHKKEDFEKCNQVMSKKLANIASDIAVFFPKWSQVGVFCFYNFVLVTWFFLLRFVCLCFLVWCKDNLFVLFSFFVFSFFFDHVYLALVVCVFCCFFSFVFTFSILVIQIARFMFYICATLCCDHVKISRLFEAKSMIGVNIVYKLLDSIDRERVSKKLCCLLYDTDCVDKVINQIGQRINGVQDVYHWYQLIIFNNFLQAVFNVTDVQYSSRHTPPCLSWRQGLAGSEDSMDMSTVSLVYVDYLIERQLSGKARNSPLEKAVFKVFQHWSSQLNDSFLKKITIKSSDKHKTTVTLAARKSLEEEVFAVQAGLRKKHADSLVQLCNVLSVFGTDGGRAIVENEAFFNRVFKTQEVAFDAVFDIFDRLKISGICQVEENTDTKSDSKENEEIAVVSGQGVDQDETQCDYDVRSFFLHCFSQYIQHISKQESKDRLFRLLTDYKSFITGSSSEGLKNQFYSNIAANENLLHDPRFVQLIKHVFKQCSHSVIEDWYLKYWDKHGIKGVIDIIHKCKFNFGRFCKILQKHPQRLQNREKCKFEEWLELIVCPSRNVPDPTKIVVCSNPPLLYQDIANMKDSKKRKRYLAKLELVLMRENEEWSKELGFAQGLEMPLTKYEKYAICNTLLEHLVGDFIPDLGRKGDIAQNKKRISFLASNAGQDLIRFLKRVAVKYSCVHFRFLLYN